MIGRGGRDGRSTARSRGRMACAPEGCVPGDARAQARRAKSALPWPATRGERRGGTPACPLAPSPKGPRVSGGPGTVGRDRDAIGCARQRDHGVRGGAGRPAGTEGETHDSAVVQGADMHADPPVLHDDVAGCGRHAAALPAKLGANPRSSRALWRSVSSQLTAMNCLTPHTRPRPAKMQSEAPCHAATLPCRRARSGQALAPARLCGGGGRAGGARLEISNDTGAAHLCTALRVPSVVIFFATDVTRWGPPHNGLHRIAGGDRRPGPAEVIAMAESLLETTAGPRPRGTRVPPAR